MEETVRGFTRGPLPVILLLVPLCAASRTDAQAGTVATDKAALVALYNATDGANWATSTNWTSEEPLSSWAGVSTNADGRVTGLALNANGLSGTLPAALGDLTLLERLELQNNHLSGSLPSELADLTKLTTLLLTGSRALTGALPDGLHELADLATVGIRNTELCAPKDDDFQAWVGAISFMGLTCPPDAQSVIDVAVFYPTLIREAWGGTEEIETQIDLLVAETNQAFLAGGVNQRVRLVAVGEVEYTQSDVGVDLSRLRRTSDGYLDEVHAIRDQFAADVVLLMRYGFGANAYAMSTVSTDFESSAFATIKTDSRIFAHELGHVMGLHHDRYECASNSCGATAFPYAHGYVNLRAFDQGATTSSRWHSVMAYDTRCDDAGFNCRQLLRFSNPEQIYPDPGGDPMGKSGLGPSSDVDGPSDAVRALNRTRGYVADFRRAPTITVSFAASQYTATEGGPAASVTVRLSEAPTRSVYVPLVATGATGGTAYDYEAPSRVTFAADETEKSFTVTATDDMADDDGETVTLGFGEPLPAGVTAGSTAIATVSLADNDTVAAAPSILAVDVTSTPEPKEAYAAGDGIEATVWFDKTVVVTGTPQLTLSVGSDSPEASYSSTAGDVVRFVYTVADGDSDDDGVSIAADSLSKNGGTIRDGANQDATLTHSASGADSEQKVDGVKPTLTVATVDADLLTLSYGEALDATSVPVGAIAVTVGGHSRSVAGVSVDGTDVTVRLDPQVVNGDVVTVSYTPGLAPLRDLVGNTAESLATRTVTNDTAEAVYDADGDGLIGITTLAQLDAIRHDMDGDGVPTTSGSTTYRAAFSQAFPDANARLRCGGSGCAGYELLDDLDFDTDGSGDANSGDTYWNSGAGWLPMGDFSAPFRATLEGNGHTIRNLFIRRPGADSVGLFGAVGPDTSWAPAGSVRGVGLVAADVAGKSRTGGLAGDQGGSVTACYVTGRVSGDGFVAGLVGSNSGDVSASYTNAGVSSTGDYAGGLVGYNSGSVTASYATGRVSTSASGHAGGLVGRNTGSISASYSTGLASHYTAGLLGSETPDSVTTSSYWDSSTSGRFAGLGTPRSTASLQTPTGHTGIYASWNVDLNGDGTADDPWNFGTTGEYPALKANADGQGAGTWQEFGYQLRSGPVLTATGGYAQTVLSWTAVPVTHWSSPPDVSYTVVRSEGSTTVETIAEAVDGLEYTDTDVPEGVYSYQVVAVVNGGEAARSELLRVTVDPPNHAPTVVKSLADLTLAVGAAVSVDVTGAFEDPDGDTLTYDASSSAPGVVSAEAVGSLVTLTSRMEGSATVTVSATDTAGTNTPAVQSLGVTVLPPRTVKVEPETLNVTEGESGTYRVVLGSQPSGNVEVTVQTNLSGTDLSLDRSSLTFTGDNWQVAQAIEVTASEDTDALVDAPVTLHHGVSGADYGSVTAPPVTVNILENDAPTLSVEDVRVGEGSGPAVFVVSLSVASSSEVTVDYATSDGSGAGGATAGADYAATQGSLTFSAGSTASRQISVSILGDTVDEAEEETFELTLSNPSNATLAGGGQVLAVTGTIEDDDDPEVEVSFDAPHYEVVEGTSTVLTLRLSAEPERRVTIPLLRTHHGGASPADYSGVPSGVTFGDSETVRELPVRAVDDTANDDGEAVTLSFGNLPARVSGSGETTLAIQDNDA
ncbi:MAG: hypothetical protein F4213_12310, partial [Boseongicola sp. SB0677_bin_26]|nr:hypothetical protein [Boseongicola sp. SB0677_bin_26]